MTIDPERYYALLLAIVAPEAMTPDDANLSIAAGKIIKRRSKGRDLCPKEFAAIRNKIKAGKAIVSIATAMGMTEHALKNRMQIYREKERRR